MKNLYYLTAINFLLFISCQNNNTKTADNSTATTNNADTGTVSYYIDVHDLEPGKVKFSDVAAAHAKDLATEGKYGVSFVKFWVDEQKGKVYCLSKAKNEESIVNTHREAHGLLPSVVYKVDAGQEAAMAGNKQLFIDVHEVGPDKVTAQDVAAAHAKDLAVESKYGVNFIDYWVDEKKGVIMCLSEAPDSNAIKSAHKEAHGLMPEYVLLVQQGQ